MMTRKDYIRLASALAHARKEIESLEFITASDILDKIVAYISYELKDDNPRFDSGRFRDAIYNPKPSKTEPLLDKF